MARYIFRCVPVAVTLDIRKHGCQPAITRRMDTCQFPNKITDFVEASLYYRSVASKRGNQTSITKKGSFRGRTKVAKRK